MRLASLLCQEGQSGAYRTTARDYGGGAQSQAPLISEDLMGVRR